ncbi:hypothetical protein AX14_013590 [Amanita brunnescens Koide BX004]|nr:hypothetical protein AX14_013590 [Amanita brunnescens Koide BX004]
MVKLVLTISLALIQLALLSQTSVGLPLGPTQRLQKRVVDPGLVVGGVCAGLCVLCIGISVTSHAHDCADRDAYYPSNSVPGPISDRPTSEPPMTTDRTEESWPAAEGSRRLSRTSTVRNSHQEAAPGGASVQTPEGHRSSPTSTVRNSRQEAAPGGASVQSPDGRRFSQASTLRPTSPDAPQHVPPEGHHPHRRSLRDAFSI